MTGRFAAGRTEWPTLAVLTGCYVVWALGVTQADTLGWIAYPIIAVSITQFSSLQHEILHGHPTDSALINEALAFPAVTLFTPYQRFRDLHLSHHNTSNLTDPLEDPESWYLDPADWDRQPAWARILLNFNNSLSGRVLLGPALSLSRFWISDFRAMLAGEGRVLRAWALHAAGLLLVGGFVARFGTISAVGYVATAYAGMSLLMIRTFLEHRAHDAVGGRSVIIEDRGPLSLLFLNNNLHAVHHAFPSRPWYQLPRLYRRQRERFLKRNRGYLFPSYLTVFRRYGLRRKEPVAHPLARRA